MVLELHFLIVLFWTKLVCKICTQKPKIFFFCVQIRCKFDITYNNNFNVFFLKLNNNFHYKIIFVVSQFCTLMSISLNQLGCGLVIDNPRKWDGFKILLVVGTRVMFKFVHRAGPIVASSHLYNHKVTLYLVL